MALHAYVAIKGFLILLIASSMFLLASCRAYQENYLGNWVGIDNSSSERSFIYEFIIESTGKNTYFVLVKRYSYAPVEGSPNKFMFVAEEPQTFSGFYNEEDGSLNTEFGALMYDVNSFQLKYANMIFVKKGTNTLYKYQQKAQASLQEHNKHAVFVN